MSKAALQRCSQSAVDVAEVSAARIELQLPSWRSCARLHVHGVVVELRQRQMPQVLPLREFSLQAAVSLWRTPVATQVTGVYMQPVGAGERQKAEEQAELGLRAEKLAAVDSLLWSTDFMSSSAAARASSGAPFSAGMRGV